MERPAQLAVLSLARLGLQPLGNVQRSLDIQYFGRSRALRDVLVQEPFSFEALYSNSVLREDPIEVPEQSK